MMVAEASNTVCIARSLERVVRTLRTLHGLAADSPSAQRNLKRAITSTENALRVYQPPRPR